MIVYKDVLQKLSAAGWSLYRIKKEKKIGGATIDRIRAGLSVSTDTIDIICRLCSCQPGDLIEYKKDSE